MVARGWRDIIRMDLSNSVSDEIAIGYVAFGEVPMPLVLLGAAIVVAAGSFVILRERALGLRRGEEPEVT